MRYEIETAIKAGRKPLKIATMNKSMAVTSPPTAQNLRSRRSRY